MEETVTMVEAAKLANVAERTIRRAVKAGRLQADLSNPKKARIRRADLDAWRAIPATQDENATRIEQLENEVHSLAAEVANLRNQVYILLQAQRVTPTTKAITPRLQQQEQVRRRTIETSLDAGEIWLADFADLHLVSRNEAQRLWSTGNIAGRKVGTGRKMRIAIGTKGQREAWAQFKILENFAKCDQCPHAV